MKVLMFGWEFPPHITGGLGTACYGLTKGLTQHDVEVTFVLPKLASPDPSSHVRLLGANRVKVKVGVKELEEFRHRVKILEVYSPLRPYISEKEYQHILAQERVLHKQNIFSIYETEFTGEYGPNLMSEIVRYSFVASLIAKTEDFDVIHAHDWMTAPAGIEAKRVSGKPLVIHAHALEFDRSGDNLNQDVYNIERAGLELADLIIAVSYYTRDRISNLYGIPKDKIRVVHNAVSREKSMEQLKISRNLEEKIVLFLGRVTFQKGPDYFIEAAQKVLQINKNVRFVMAGTGDMFPRMVELTADKRLGENFHFIGSMMSRSAVEKLYAMSDLYIMPSVSEPFGITPLEAMVYNIPIIVSKQSGVAEILEQAIKIDFWDVQLLAEKIIEILTNPDLAQKMVEAGSRQLQNIKWEIAAQKVKSIYQELVDRQIRSGSSAGNIGQKASNS